MLKRLVFLIVLLMPSTAFASIAYIAASHANGSSGGTVAAPTGAVSGNFLIAYTTGYTGYGTISGTGWTSISTCGNNTFPLYARAYYLQYAGTGSPWTWSGNADVIIRAYSGVSSSTPIDQSACFGNGTGSATSATIPSMTATANANEEYVGFFSNFNSTITLPGGFGDTISQGLNNNEASGDFTLGSSGSTVSSQTATASSAAWMAFGATLVPAASSPTGLVGFIWP